MAVRKGLAALITDALGNLRVTLYGSGGAELGGSTPGASLSVVNGGYPAAASLYRSAVAAADVLAAVG